ncbi:MAG: hypothetical protein ACRDRT_12395 [Pseudonocardiaceae bacterium]
MFAKYDMVIWLTATPEAAFAKQKLKIFGSRRASSAKYFDTKTQGLRSNAKRLQGCHSGRISVP